MLIFCIFHGEYISETANVIQYIREIKEGEISIGMLFYQRLYFKLHDTLKKNEKKDPKNLGSMFYY